MKLLSHQSHLTWPLMLLQLLVTLATLVIVVVEVLTPGLAILVVVVLIQHESMVFINKTPQNPLDLSPLTPLLATIVRFVVELVILLWSITNTLTSPIRVMMFLLQWLQCVFQMILNTLVHSGIQILVC